MYSERCSFGSSRHNFHRCPTIRLSLHSCDYPVIRQQVLELMNNQFRHHVRTLNVTFSAASYKLNGYVTTLIFHFFTKAFQFPRLLGWNGRGVNWIRAPCPVRAPDALETNSVGDNYLGTTPAITCSRKRSITK